MIKIRHSSLTERTEHLATAIAVADGRASIETVAFAQATLHKVEGRLEHGSEHTLVALLGATGGGKSSLANAVAHTDAAVAGIRRPTTSSTLALYWPGDDPSALLDWLEVQNRHTVADNHPQAEKLSGLVLLDVPDHDSVESANREEMERIASHADLLLWVTDHEKYADLALHQYLRQLNNYEGVMAMVLNKSDQLSAQEVDACRRDLSRLIEADGIDTLPVLPVSTVTGDGLPDVITLLEKTVDKKRAMMARLSSDITTVATELLEEIGEETGTAKVPNKLQQQLARHLVDAAGLDVVTEAVAAGHRRDASARLGWPYIRWVRALRPHPLRKLRLNEGSTGRSSIPAPSGIQRTRSEAAVRDVLHQATENLDAPWPDLIRDKATPDPNHLADQLEQAVSGAARDSQGSTPLWWRVVNGLQLVLALIVLAGVIWLTLLAANAWLRLPEPPMAYYPDWDRYRIPLPTTMLAGGVFLGLLLAMISKQFAALGARRRARAVRRNAERSVADIAQNLVIQPLEAELEAKNTMIGLLQKAKG